MSEKTYTFKDRVLLLKTCSKSGKTYKGFQWPLEVGAEVTAPDWDPNPERECGGGLHGFAHGEGDGVLLDRSPDAKWLVVSADPSDVLPRKGGKSRFRSCRVEHVGDQKSATDFIDEHDPGHIVVGISRSGDDRSTFVGGDYCVLTGGPHSTLIGGNRSTLTGGPHSVLIGSFRSVLGGGGCSTLTWRLWDDRYYRLHTVYVGENGIRANTPYQWVNGKAMEVENE